MKLFKTKIRFLGYEIKLRTTKLIQKSIEFTDKFWEQILNKTQLQILLGSLNYVLDYYKNLKPITKPLYDKLKKNPPLWTNQHTEIIKIIKN